MKIKGTDHYYALLCDCQDWKKGDVLICGIYSTKKEAKGVADEIKDCGARHIIRKCSVVIEIKERIDIKN